MHFQHPYGRVLKCSWRVLHELQHCTSTLCSKESASCSISCIFNPYKIWMKMIYRILMWTWHRVFGCMMWVKQLGIKSWTFWVRQRWMTLLNNDWLHAYGVHNIILLSAMHCLTYNFVFWVKRSKWKQYFVFHIVHLSKATSVLYFPAQA